MLEDGDFAVPVNILTPFVCAPLSWAAPVCLDTEKTLLFNISKFEHI